MQVRKILSQLCLLGLIGIPLGFFGVTSYQTQALIAWSNNTPKKVAAFYYPWYGNTTDFSSTSPYNISDSPNWWHWDSAEINHYDPPTNASSANTPQWGYYDSADPKIIETHLRQAEWAGIDAFVSSYWGKNGQELKNMKTMIEIAKSIHSNLTIAPYFETALGGMTEKNATAQETLLLDEFRSLYTFMTDPQYKAHLWYEDGKPVVWIYVVRFVAAEVWINVINTLQAENKQFFWVADRPNRNDQHIQQFQAQHQYDVYAPIRDNNYFDVYYAIKQDCKKFHQVFVTGVGPAYNDTLVRAGNAPYGRAEGQYYTDRWNDALSLNPDWISIVSWNEWHEGTEIEPSLQDGDLALNQTRQFIQQFKTASYTTLKPHSEAVVYSQIWNQEIFAVAGIGVGLGIAAWLLRGRRNKNRGINQDGQVY